MKQKTILITQSNYIPWKGYFDLINRADHFVVFDEMQYTRRDWRNRNKIKTPAGLQWLTVPVQVKGRFEQKISQTRIEGGEWAKAHWKTLCQNYSKAQYFDEMSPRFEQIYLGRPFELLSDLNLALIEAVCDVLEIETEVSSSSAYHLAEDRTERLVSICRELEGTNYITGPAAKNYMDEQKFREAGIAIEYFDYSNYPKYRQLYGEFVHEVSILDLIFNEGPNSRNFLKSVSFDGPGRLQ